MYSFSAPAHDSSKQGLVHVLIIFCSHGSRGRIVLKRACTVCPRSGTTSPLVLRLLSVLQLQRGRLETARPAFDYGGMHQTIFSGQRTMAIGE